ncbi:unnamed protein product [Spirodela intermedia]|uniref:Uncharacterized protein n=1 Tax=Spirodela intermedia TaxID=51605 RepID=A0A7I8J9M0_SPIIN|nr:unnamed protein product [Spirodela intermedia]CAA6666857.1 unnamed protein product [Spirodela intermedia]
MDMFGMRTTKGFSVMMGFVALASVTLLGLYVWFICLKQMAAYNPIVYSKPIRGMNLGVEECLTSGARPGNRSHYPRPTSYSRAECACNPVHFFAILSMQRSGSGWFETLLNSHLNVSSNGEIFSVKQRRSNVSSILSTLDKVYNLDWFSSASKNECSAAVGFKWMFNQGVLRYHEDVVDYFKRRGVSGVFLLRRNLLDRMISIIANTYDQSVKPLNGTHKSHVHSKEEAEVLASYKPTINVSSLIPDLRRAEEMAAEAVEYFKSTRHMIFTTRTSDLISRQVKIHTKPLSEQIENWEEVRDALKGTKYEGFLAPRGNPSQPLRRSRRHVM